MESNAQTSARTWIAPRMEDDDDRIDLLQLWETVWRRKWSILSLVVVVVMVAVLAVLSATPVYRAAATLLIEQEQANVVSIEQVYGLEGTGSEYLQTQFELLKSRVLAERVVRELGLTTHPEFDPRQQPEPLISFSLSGLIAQLGISPVKPVILPDDLEPGIDPTEAMILDDVTDIFMGRISIAPQGKSQLVKVEVDMADPRMAARAANALARGFIEAQMEATMSMSAEASAWMNSRLGELGAKLKAAEERLQAFREKENLVDVDGVNTISAAELSATRERMIDARRQRAEAESQYQQVQAMGDSGWEKLATIPAVLGHPLIQQFKADEARARAKVEELSKRYGSRHPAMEAARTELLAATASLKGQVEQIVAGIERNYQLALANENSLKSSYGVNREQIQDISRKEFQVRELQREVDTNRALYETFMTRLKETTATADLQAANARLVDPAKVPKLPVKPKKSLIVAITGLLALFAGIGLTLLLDALNNTFKSTEDVEDKLNLPVLGILPLVKNMEPRQVAHLFSSNEDRRFAESVRTIRTSMVFSPLQDEPHQILVITSSVLGEGKSTVAANLSFALGRMERVLLIDADLRRPTLARNFDFPVGTPGLANLIAGTARLEDCVKQVEGIDMIGAGVVPPNPLELLSSPRFERLIEMMRLRYDRIVIDSPPTQAVSDAIVLASLANAVLYVVKAEATPVPIVQKGVGQLLQNNAPVTGVIINQVDVKAARKYGYHYNDYTEYYGHAEVQQSGKSALASAGNTAV